MFKSITFSSFLMLNSIITWGQNESERTNYNANIDQVFGATYFLDKPELKECFVELLHNRISYTMKTGVPLESVPLLSSTGNNKNWTSTFPLVYDSLTFNPLVYNFDYFAISGVQVFRIDGTDYFITIQSQNITR